MKNLFDTLDKFIQGYSKRTLTAKFLNDNQKKEKELAVKREVEDLEREIIQRSKSNETCLVKIVSGFKSKANQEVLMAALEHFKEKGFKILEVDLSEIGDQDTKILVLSWKDC